MAASESAEHVRLRSLTEKDRFKERKVYNAELLSEICSGLKQRQAKLTAGGTAASHDGLDGGLGSTVTGSHHPSDFGVTKGDYNYPKGDKISEAEPSDRGGGGGRKPNIEFRFDLIDKKELKDGRKKRRIIEAKLENLSRSGH